MKNIHYILLAGIIYLLSMPLSTSAQTEDEEGGEVFTVVENNPQFPGGEKARQKYLQENIYYPKEAREKGIEGIVYITFIVEKDGSISNVEVLRGHELLAEEAIRVVKAMPRWQPGTQRGKPVRVQFNMPVRFSLNSGDSKTENKKKKSPSDKKSIL